MATESPDSFQAWAVEQGRRLALAVDLYNLRAAGAWPLPQPAGNCSPDVLRASGCLWARPPRMFLSPMFEDDRCWIDDAPCVGTFTVAAASEGNP